MSIVENACRLHILPEQVCAGEYRRDPDVPRLVELVAHRIPELAQCPEYADRLAQPVAVALGFARSLAAGLGAPRRLDRDQWTRDPFIPILFESLEDGARLLARSEAVRHVFEAGARNCSLLMTMQRHEYEIMGGDLDGDIVRRDVLQTVVSFEEHAIWLAAPTEGLARAAIVDGIVQYLAELVPRRLHQAELLRGELEQSERVLKAQLHTLEQASREHRSFEVPEDLRDKLQDGRHEATLFASQLRALPKDPGPSEYLGMVRDVLLHPDAHLLVDDVRMHVQDYGIKTTQDKGREIRFTELRAWGLPRTAVLFAALGRDTAKLLWPELAVEA